MKQKKMVKKRKLKNKLLKYFIYFVIFSFMGALIEFLFGFFSGATIIAYDKAMYEMFNIKFYFIPFYGLVGVCLIFFENLFEKINKHKIKIVYPGLLNGIFIVLWELIGGLFSILVYGHNFWDYSNDPLNFLGIISLRMSLLWILMGYFFNLIYHLIIKKI